MIGSRSLGTAIGSLNDTLNARSSANLDSFSFFNRSFFFCCSRSFSSVTNALNRGATSSGCLVCLEDDEAALREAWTEVDLESKSGPPGRLALDEEPGGLVVLLDFDKVSFRWVVSVDTLDKTVGALLGGRGAEAAREELTLVPVDSLRGPSREPFIFRPAF